VRLPLVTAIDSRDGSDAKDALLSNVLAEAEDEVQFAAVRPGLEVAATSTGNGNGIVCFNGELVSIFGAVLGDGIEVSSGAVVVSSYNEPLVVGDLGPVLITALSNGKFLIGWFSYDDDLEEFIAKFALYDPITDTNQTINALETVAGADKEIQAAVNDETIMMVIQSVGQLWESLDNGLTWEIVGSGLEEFTNRSVNYSNGTWVVCDIEKVRWSVNDGATWSYYTFPVDISDFLVFIGASSVYTGGAWYFYISWLDFSAPQERVICFTTSDFITFTELSITQQITLAAYSDGVFYAQYANVLYSCNDGVSFTVDVNNDGFLSLFWSNDKLYSLTTTSVFLIEGTTFTLITDDITVVLNGYGAVNPDESVFILNDSIRLDVSEVTNTIPSVAPVANTKYDFCQSAL
jgi:hypothetical protein